MARGARALRALVAFFADFFADFLAAFGAAFFAAFLAAFFAVFFGAAFRAFLAAFFAAFFADFLATFFAALVTRACFFTFLLFLAFFAFAIVVLLLPPTNSKMNRRNTGTVAATAIVPFDNVPIADTCPEVVGRVIGKGAAQPVATTTGMRA